MFEKEAKEYTHTKHCEKCGSGHCEKKCILVKDDFETFKDGAEFGYNKAKENEKLKTKKIPQLERKIASIRGAHSVDCKKLNARTEQVERLKKENAELKEKVGKYQIGMFDEIEKRDKRLTKAEELIEKLLNTFASNDFFEEEELSAMAEAEQFLKG